MITLSTKANEISSFPETPPPPPSRQPISRVAYFSTHRSTFVRSARSRWPRDEKVKIKLRVEEKEDVRAGRDENPESSSFTRWRSFSRTRFLRETSRYNGATTLGSRRISRGAQEDIARTVHGSSSFEPIAREGKVEIPLGSVLRKRASFCKNRLLSPTRGRF